MIHKIIRFYVTCTLLGMCFIGSWSHAAVWTIIYPKPEFESDLRHEYPVALLDLALQKTSVRYELRASSKALRQTRALKRLEENLEINILWAMTSISREKHLLPIRIPITRGLIGLRALVSHKKSVFLNTKINNLQDLQKFSPVQGISWPDTKILQANGFNVVTAQSYAEAATLTQSNAVDFFPRSIVEVGNELKNEYSRDLRVKNGVYLSYPSAFYYFTNKRNLTLSKLIETGLLRAIEDGSYQALFDEHFGEVLSQANIDHSQVFMLINPLLPEMTPVGEAKYWYFPPMEEIKTTKKAL